MGEIRIGRVSSIDAATGRVRVVYKDKGNAVTALLPMLSHEYNMPKIDDMVLVLHLSNGKESGVVVGTFWGAKLPDESGDGLYKKRLDKSGKSYIKCKDGMLAFKSAGISLEGEDGTLTLRKLIEMKDEIDKLKTDVQVLQGYHK